MDKLKAKVIAFYLPQFHPIPENDKWWGKGFTEWTNVGKAKKLYPGHFLPRVPSDLGYYDLRLPEVREAQAELAKEAGVTAFCYWHYWFGNGNQLLEKPLQEVISTGKPDFPFCLGWANHTWFKKGWNSDVSRLSKEVLINQTYQGIEDIDNHFYTMLPAFKDKRYFRIKNKLVFLIYSIEDIPEPNLFINRWQELAANNDLPEFFFIGHTSKIEKVRSYPYSLLDGINLHLLPRTFNHSNFIKLISWLIRIPLNVVNYSNAMNKWEDNIIKENSIFPTIYPNWDTTPRLGLIGQVLHNSTPTLFKKHISRIINMIEMKEEDYKIIFLKSWNEWAECNYLEPDIKFGKGYINALKQVLSDK